MIGAASHGHDTGHARAHSGVPRSSHCCFANKHLFIRHRDTAVASQRVVSFSCVRVSVMGCIDVPLEELGALKSTFFCCVCVAQRQSRGVHLVSKAAHKRREKGRRQEQRGQANERTNERTNRNERDSESEGKKGVNERTHQRTNERTIDRMNEH